MNNAKKNKSYDVEYIITYRTKGKKHYYLIKWEGYSIKIAAGNQYLICQILWIWSMNSMIIFLIQLHKKL